MAKTDREKLRLWQERLMKNAAAYSGEEAEMDRREALYRGGREIRPVTDSDYESPNELFQAAHVRNIVAESIESILDNNVPQPKVAARRKKDERLAALIENLIRNELDRMPFEEINDIMERTVPIQGGGFYLVEWDNTKRTHTTVGEVTVSPIHPKQVIPQDGVYTGIEDMDYIILKVPQTKEYIKRRYFVDVSEESEAEPEVKAADIAAAADDMVTQYIAYYRNEEGGIGIFSWVNDIPLEDLRDYQARQLPRCGKCGAVKMLVSEANGGGGAEESACPLCGCRDFETEAEEFEELYREHMRSDGTVIPGAVLKEDLKGMPYMAPTRIPFYKPNLYPLVLQKNISVYGRFLGDSDVDKIKDQQNTMNRLSKKIIDRLIKAGTRVTLPDRPDFRMDPKDGEKWYIGNAADKQLIDVYEFSGDVQTELLYRAEVYEEARQILGITESFQGRRDSTATSGKAKEFAAAQTAGRLESKRVMKDAAYARLFELIFKFRLAYSDEPRTVVSKDEQGGTKYDIFDRYDFLDQDSAGEWYWNDQFLFSVDGSAQPANNRSAMWQETTAHLQAGAYGNPEDPNTLILYWTKMDMLHYPGAAETKSYLEKRLGGIS